MKKYFKKRLAVLMAVLMVLSCWVFVAPEAEAITAGQYYIKFTAKITDNWQNGSGKSKIYIDYKSNNGTGTSGTQEYTQAEGFWNKTENRVYTVFEGYISGFPVQIRHYTSLTWPRTLKYTDGTLYVGKDAASCTNVVFEGGSQNVSSGSRTNTLGSVGTSYYPYASKVETASGFSKNPATVPASGTNTTSASFTAYDQYNVRLCSSLSNTNPGWNGYEITPNTGITVSSGPTNNSTSSGTSSGYTLSIANGAKALFAAHGTNSRTITFKPKFTFNGKTATGSATFTLNNLTYTYTYNSNGGNTMSPASATVYYGDRIGASNVPSGTKTGYELIGMYTSTKANSYSFTKPTAGSTSGYTGQLTANTQMDANKTWYAAWWAKNVSVEFRNNDGTSIKTITGKYDQPIMSHNSGGIPADPTYKTVPGATGTYDYEFSHWAVLSAKDAGGNDYNDIVGQDADSAVLKGDTVFVAVYAPTKHNYTVTFYNEDGSVLSQKSDYTYRDSIVQPTAPTKSSTNEYNYSFIGWAIKDSANSHVVENGVDIATGKVVAVLGDDSFIVRRDLELVPVFERAKNKYTVSFTYMNSIGEQQVVTYDSLEWGDPVTAPEVPATYTQSGYRYPFTGWNATVDATCLGSKEYVAQYGDGTPAVYDVKFVDGEGNTISEAQYKHGEAIVVPANPQPYRDSQYEYTFKAWTPAIISPADRDMVYTAEYTAEKLYTYTYYNEGTVVATVQQTAGEALELPAETPTKPADNIADAYTFSGWQDSDGNVYTADSVVEAADKQLYAAYDITYHNYTVTFLQDDGSLIAEYKLHYGDTVTLPEAVKASDNTYNYTFRAWTPDPVATCVGDATYTATYRKGYNYYEVQWLTDTGATFRTEQYIYNERINPPTTTPECTTMTPQDENYSIAFAGWYNVATDEPFVRGERITGPAKYYPKYEQVARECTVRLYDRTDAGTTLLQTLTVAYGGSIENLYNAPVGSVTADTHSAFSAWVDVNGNPVDIANITDDIDLYATYVVEAHDWEVTDVILAPTFHVNGQVRVECSVCRRADTQVAQQLSDTIAPTIAVYIDNSKWTGVNEFEDEATPASPSSFLTVTGSDTAEVNDPYNIDGMGSGIADLQLYMLEVNSKADAIDPTTITEWGTVADYDPGELNFTVRMNLSRFEDGHSYIVYVKLTDDCGNVAYASTNVFTFDSTLPTLIVSGNIENSKKFCEYALIYTEDDISTLRSFEIDGEAIDLSQIANADAPYEYTTPGKHYATLIDKAGNTTTATFTIVGSHNFEAVTIQPTCTEDGSQFERCTLCGETTAAIAIPALNHYFPEESSVYTEPTCLIDGYWTYVCANGCGTTSIVPDTGSAKGEHTWGEWIIDKEVTCSNEGAKHRICSVCSASETEIIPIPDASSEEYANAHAWYKNRTIEATCTTAGEVYHVCKYCGTREVVEVLDALGHTADENWTVITPATCVDAGLQVKYCINDGCEEADGNPHVCESEVIPATGEHSWKVDRVVDPTGTDQGYTVYKCTVCGAEKTGNYVDPTVKITITFYDEDKTTVLGTVEDVLKGEYVTELAAPLPTKAADETYKYTFDQWLDENGDPIEFPIVAGDTNISAYASYSQRYVNYSVTLLREDGTQYKKIGYKHNGETVVIDDVLAKDSDRQYDYAFMGWKLQGDTGSTGATEFTINAADITLVPVYEATTRKYTVVFAYDAENVIEMVTVEAGSKAECSVTPTKQANAAYHYVFKAWSSSVDEIWRDTYVTPNFTEVAHSYTKSEVTQQATCTLPEITTYTCDCGYSYDRQSAPANGHTWGESYIDENGDCVKECQVCHIIEADTTIYTVTFINEGTTIKNIGYLKYGQYLTAEQLPAAPTKAEDASYTYKFAGWALADDDTNTIVDPTTVKITGDASYKAVYTATEKTYTVVFAIDSDHVLKVYRNVKAGSAVVYDGATPEPLTAYDTYGHYVFSGWSSDTANVTTDMYVTAVFAKEDHNLAQTESPATCTEAKGIKHYCTECGFSYVQTTGAALGHDWVIVQTVAPTFDSEGYIDYKCSRCGETKREVLPEKDYFYIHITVIDTNGNPVQGALVSLYYEGAFVTSGTTDENGKVTLVVEEAKEYDITISGRDISAGTGTVVVNPDGSVDTSGMPSVSVYNCTCTCHRDGIWPTIFRFFHKIIKMLVGEFRCCANPDARYNS